MSEFKVGDRVRDLYSGYSFLTPGVSRGTVVRVPDAGSPSQLVQVVWDATARVPYGDDGWNSRFEEVQRVTKFRVGDQVRAIRENFLGIVLTVYPEGFGKGDTRVGYDVEQIVGWHANPTPNVYPGWYYYEQELEEV